MTPSRKPYTKPRAKEAVLTLAALNYSPSQIEEYLIEKASETIHAADSLVPFVPNDEIPSLRTIQRLMEKNPRKDASGTWSLLTGDASEAERVLGVLGEILHRSRGGGIPVTVAEGEMIARIRRCCPSLPGAAVYRLARAYLDCLDSGTPTTVLDAGLAFRPWESQEASDEYYKWWYMVPSDSPLQGQHVALLLADVVGVYSVYGSPEPDAGQLVPSRGAASTKEDSDE